MRPPVSLPQAAKDPSVQALRGLAVLLMVAGHVIGHDPSRGLQAGDGTALRWAYMLLDDVRMPFFTVLSGWVYALRPVGPGSDLALFHRKKVRRLLVPFVTVGVLLLLVQLAVPGTNVDPTWRSAALAFVYGIEHLWFLQAIFLVFLVVSAIDGLGLARRPARWWPLVGAMFVAAAVVSVPMPYAVFSINGAIWLLPFFLTGVGLRRWGVLAAPGWPIRLALAAGLLVTIAVPPALAAGGLTLPRPADRALSLAVGLVGVCALYAWRRVLQAAWLVRLGGYSYGIYLFHVFGAAGSRIVLMRAGVESVPVLFVCGMIAAVLLPIALEVSLGRVPLIATLFFGRAPSAARRPLPRPA